MTARPATIVPGLLILAAPALPLRIFIPAGQTNRAGHAKIGTFDSIGNEPATALLHTQIEADHIPPAGLARRPRGGSNASYHYPGCANTFALTGKAFAEITPVQRKKGGGGLRLCSIPRQLSNSRPIHYLSNK